MTTKPTQAELEILKVLWEFGSATVRFVHDKIRVAKNTTYTSTLKTMQIMAKKGLLGRNESHRSHVYFPMIKKSQAQRVLLNGVLETAFGGSTKALVMGALGQGNTTPQELHEIRDFLDRMEKGES